MMSRKFTYIHIIIYIHMTHSQKVYFSTMVTTYHLKRKYSHFYVLHFAHIIKRYFQQYHVVHACLVKFMRCSERKNTVFLEDFCYILRIFSGLQLLSSSFSG